MSTEIKEAVRESYGRVARSERGSQDDGVRAVARAFGYSESELGSIPAEANMGLSCGNPIAFASLKPGEVVVDLGCGGGGLDVFLAARRVGTKGTAIGIDMTQDMIALARRNLVKFQAETQGQAGTVEFHLAEIDHMPLADASVDCVISNCVINLAPDKQAVFREAARVLRPGGRFAVSDIVLKKELPSSLHSDLLAYVGCIAGAISVDEYRQGLIAAGFSAVDIVDSGANLNSYTLADGASSCCASSPSTNTATESGCCGSGGAPAATKNAARKPFAVDQDVNEFAASVRVFAVKPT